jgi:hypothetical protein
MMKNPIKTVQVCLDEQTQSELRAAAREEDRSASSIVRLALRAYLRRSERVVTAA